MTKAAVGLLVMLTDLYDPVLLPSLNQREVGTMLEIKLQNPDDPWPYLNSLGFSLLFLRLPV